MAIDIIARGMIESSKSDISQLFDITKGGEIVNNESSYTLNNAVDCPLLGLNLYGKSTQDGTPTPENPIDIVSVGDSGSVGITACGKNLAHFSDTTNGGHHNGITWSCKNGLVKATGTTSNLSSSIEGGVKCIFHCLPAGEYIVSGSSGYVKVYALVIDKNGNNIYYSDNFTLDGTEASVTIYCQIKDKGITVDTTVAPMLVKGSTTTDYESYKDTAASITTALPLCGIPVESGGNYTDSSGQQWVCDELIYNADGTGKIIKRTKKTTITSDITPSYDGVSTKDSNVHIFDYPYSKLGMTDYKFYNTNYITIEMNMGKMLTKFMARTDASVNSFKCLADGEFGTNTLNGSEVYDNYLEIGTSKASTVEEFKALINGCEIVYILATPQEIELTAAEMAQLRQLQTFNGITNISNDSGADMDVKICTNKTLAEYVVPITMGLQKQIDELKAAVISLGGNV